MNTSSSHHSSGLILGLDYGRKWIGVAIGETITGSCRALLSIRVKSQEGALLELSKLIEEWNPERIVLGLPYHLDGSEGNLSAEIRAFGAQLEDRHGRAVEFWNEALSTEGVRHEFLPKRSQHNQRSGREYLNAAAAREILSGWINHHVAT